MRKSPWLYNNSFIEGVTDIGSAVFLILWIIFVHIFVVDVSIGDSFQSWGFAVGVCIDAVINVGYLCVFGYVFVRSWEGRGQGNLWEGSFLAGVWGVGG